MQERSGRRNLLVHYAQVVLPFEMVPVISTSHTQLNSSIKNTKEKAPKDMSSEEDKKCWRCGYKILSGSICAMCGSVNESSQKELLDGDPDDERKRFPNPKHVIDYEGEAFSESDTTSGPITGHLEGKMENKRVGVLLTKAQSHLTASVTVSEAHNGASRGDKSVDLHQPLAMGPDHNKRAAAVTNRQEKIKWIQHVNERPVLLLVC